MVTANMTPFPVGAQEAAETEAQRIRSGGEPRVSKRLGSPYRSGRSADWVKVKTLKAPAAAREAEEDWS